MSTAFPAAYPPQADCPAFASMPVDVHSLPTPAAVFDDACRILDCNEGFAGLAGMLSGSPHSVTSLVGGVYPPACETSLPLGTAVHTVATTGQPTPTHVTTLNHGTDIPQWLQIHCCPCAGHPDRPPVIMVQIVDVTDAISRSGQQAKNSDESQQITNRICHDLMAPVSTARGLLGIAEEDVSEGMYEEVPELLRDVGLQLVRLDRLIHDFSALSRTDRPSEAPSELQLDLLLEQWCHQQQRASPELPQHTVRTDFATTSMVCETDRVQQILSALLRNATSFVDPGESAHDIQISTRRGNNSTVIEVSDNGPGIEPGMESVLFELFARGTSEQCGHGLGLHIAWKHLMKMGGSIRLAHHGKPTTFEIVIPDARPPVQDL